MHRQLSSAAIADSAVSLGPAGASTSSLHLPSRPSNPCLQEIDDDTRIVVGNAGDHLRVQALLTQHYQTELTDDFQSRLDEPSYEPADRMLVLHHGELVGHIHLSRQSAWFDHERMPVAAVRDCVIRPEYQSPALMKTLLETAEDTALREGSILALARPEPYEFFARQGWSVCRAQGHTQANTRALLAHLIAQTSTRKHRHPNIEIRTWRHFELEAIQPVYEQVASSMWGSLYRNEDAWRWLVGRKAHDQILIAVRHKHGESSDNGKLDVVGYAVVRESCVVEMVSLPGFACVRPLLMARACRDAIDRDHHFVSLHTEATDPLHELLVMAGGSWHPSSPQGGQWMLKLLAPQKWVERLYPKLYRRAREAGIARPLEIGFAVDDRRYRFIFTRRSARLEHALPSAPVHVACGELAFQNLLLSNLTWPAAVEHGHLQVGNSQCAAVLAALFPPRLFWQSPFELLRL